MVRHVIEWAFACENRSVTQRLRPQPRRCRPPPARTVPLPDSHAPVPNSGSRILRESFRCPTATSPTPAVIGHVPREPTRCSTVAPPNPAVAGHVLREPARCPTATSPNPPLQAATCENRPIAQQSRPIIAHVGPWTNTMTRQWEKLSTSEKVGFSRFFSFRHANRPFSDHRTKKHHPHKPNDLSSLS